MSARVVRLSSKRGDVADEVVNFAKEHNVNLVVTQIALVPI